MTIFLHVSRNNLLNHRILTHRKMISWKERLFILKWCFVIMQFSASDPPLTKSLKPHVNHFSEGPCCLDLLQPSLKFIFWRTLSFAKLFFLQLSNAVGIAKCSFVSFISRWLLDKWQKDSSLHTHRGFDILAWYHYSTLPTTAKKTLPAGNSRRRQTETGSFMSGKH